MSYTKKYYLERVKQANEIYLEHSKKGIPNEKIYKEFIKPKLFISRSTFYNYLTVTYRKELEQLNNKK